MDLAAVSSLNVSSALRGLNLVSGLNLGILKGTVTLLHKSAQDLPFQRTQQIQDPAPDLPYLASLFTSEFEEADGAVTIVYPRSFIFQLELSTRIKGHFNNQQPITNAVPEATCRYPLRLTETYSRSLTYAKHVLSLSHPLSLGCTMSSPVVWARLSPHISLPLDSNAELYIRPCAPLNVVVRVDRPAF